MASNDKRSQKTPKRKGGAPLDGAAHSAGDGRLATLRARYGADVVPASRLAPPRKPQPCRSHPSRGRSTLYRVIGEPA